MWREGAHEAWLECGTTTLDRGRPTLRTWKVCRYTGRIQTSSNRYGRDGSITAELSCDGGLGSDDCRSSSCIPSFPSQSHPSWSSSFLQSSWPVVLELCVHCNFRKARTIPACPPTPVGGSADSPKRHTCFFVLLVQYVTRRVCGSTTAFQEARILFSFLFAEGVLEVVVWLFLRPCRHERGRDE